MCERVLLELNPATSYTFPSHHKRILEPYNYYAFGQRYIRWVAAPAPPGQRYIRWLPLPR